MDEVSLSAIDTGRIISQETSLILFSVRCWVNPRDIVRPDGLRQWKFPIIPSGIGHATFRLVAQCLNELRQVLCKLNNNYSIYNNCSYTRFCFCKFLSFSSGIVLVYILLWCAAASLGYWLPTFWDDVLVSSLWVTMPRTFWPLNMVVKRRFGAEWRISLCYPDFLFQGTRVAVRLGATF
jgi:hypothetical protein